MFRVYRKGTKKRKKVYTVIDTIITCDSIVYVERAVVI
jgi:hypothetical protein